MAELGFDVIEQILVRSDVEDLLRCKSVCKSWRSFISSPRFVKAHLHHTCKYDPHNHELQLKRISHEIISSGIPNRYISIMGSCDGLVCVFRGAFDFVITNPSTREMRNLHTPSDWPKCLMECWGFGYDLGTDDYKVIAGFMWEKKGMQFHLLSLKSNTYKVIDEPVNYSIVRGRPGVLCDGSLHWIMSTDANAKKVIVSLDLCTEEFEEIPPPDDEEYEHDYYILGVTEDGLCLYPSSRRLSKRKWVMRNKKWEVYSDGDRESECDATVSHSLKLNIVSFGTSYVYSLEDAQPIPSAWNYHYLSDCKFVKSLVSPQASPC